MDKNTTTIAAAIGAGLLIVTGLIIMRPKGKRTGASTTATLTFRHKGSGGPFDLGFGIAKASPIKLGPVEEFFPQTVEIGNHPIPTKVKIKLNPVEWPDVPQGKYDAMAFVQIQGGQLDPGGEGFLDASWKKKAFEDVDG